MGKSIEEATRKGMIEDSNLKYIYQTNWESGWQQCDWYPNVSTLTSNNYADIASFFSKL